MSGKDEYESASLFPYFIFDNAAGGSQCFLYIQREQTHYTGFLY
jgi:hypothetical protein